MNIFNEVLNGGQFLKKILQALITTISKPDKDPSLPCNYRPISLLNSDLKIYRKDLALRLLDLLLLLVYLDQVGFIKGCQAPDATRSMLYILMHIELHKIPALYLALDAEKAFDRVHWGYLTVVLQKFGFQGPTLCAIMALYTQPLCQNPFIRSIIISIFYNQWY